MDLGTVAYLKHTRPLDFFNQARQIAEVFEDYNYVRKLPDNFLGNPKGIGYFCLTNSRKNYFSNFSEIPQDLSAIREIALFFMNEESERRVSAIYRILADYDPLAVHVAVWKLKFEGIDIHPSYAFDYASIQYKKYCQSISQMTYYYSMEEVFLVYNLIKKLYLEIGFDLAAGSRADEYLGYGERISTDEGFDRLFRFDANGTNRLIKPYEEGRTIAKEDIYDGNRNGFFVDFDHPVPIIMQEPPYNVPDVSVT